MVCVPCIVIPVFLFLWHRYIQPFILRFWNPFGLLDDGSNKIVTTKKVGMFDVKIISPKTKETKNMPIETAKSAATCPIGFGKGLSKTEITAAVDIPHSHPKID